MIAVYFRAWAYVVTNHVSLTTKLSTEASEMLSGSIQGAERTERFMHIIRFKIEAEPYPPLMLLLSLGFRAKQKDNRDKVYGLLALMAPHISSAIVTDYGQSVAQVYYKFARAVIKATGQPARYCLPRTAKRTEEEEIAATVLGS